MSALYFYTTIILQQVLLLKQDDFEPSLHDIHVIDLKKIQLSEKNMTSKIFLYFFIIKKKSFKFNSTNHKHEQFLKINLKK